MIRACKCILLLAGSLACVGWPQKPPHPGCPVAPVPVHDLLTTSELRLRVELRRGKHRIGLEVVARPKGDELVVIGMASHGSRLFTVTQRATNLDVRGTRSDRAGVLAHWVMDLLHRVYWIGAETGASDEPGTTRFQWADEEVEDRWGAEGRSRTFARREGGSAERGATIDYPPLSRDAASRPVEVRNDWCGYEASVVAL